VHTYFAHGPPLTDRRCHDFVDQPLRHRYRGRDTRPAEVAETGGLKVAENLWNSMIGQGSRS
jgi:hypothetical protein